MEKIDPQGTYRRMLREKFRPPYTWLTVARDETMPVEVIQVVLTMQGCDATDPETLLAFLASAQRRDLIEQLAQTERYGEAAREELHGRRPIQSARSA